MLTTHESVTLECGATYHYRYDFFVRYLPRPSEAEHGSAHFKAEIIHPDKEMDGDEPFHFIAPNDASAASYVYEYFKRGDRRRVAETERLEFCRQLTKLG